MAFKNVNMSIYKRETLKSQQILTILKPTKFLQGFLYFCFFLSANFSPLLSSLILSKKRVWMS